MQALAFHQSKSDSGYRIHLSSLSAVLPIFVKYTIGIFVEAQAKVKADL
jgi:hypothetical protein